MMIFVKAVISKKAMIISQITETIQKAQVGILNPKKHQVQVGVRNLKDSLIQSGVLRTKELQPLRKLDNTMKVKLQLIKKISIDLKM